MMKLYNIGYVAGFHGLKGEMKIKSTTDFAQERFIVANTLFLSKDKDLKEVKIKSVRFHKGFYLIAFEGLDSLTKVEKYKGFTLSINEEMLYELEDDEYYYFELVGMSVYDYQNNFLGDVTSVMETGANEVLVVKNNDKEILIPFVDSFFESFDEENKKIVLKEVEGLF